MRIRRHARKATITVRSVLALVAMVTAVALVPVRARGATDAAADSPLGVAFTSLPAGWSVATPGQYTPGFLVLINPSRGEVNQGELAVQPLGLAVTSNEEQAASVAADRLVKESNFTGPITRTPMRLGSAAAVMLQGMPGPANVQFAVAHAGALYDIVTLGSDTLLPGQQQALAALHFIPRVGQFPSRNPAAPYTPPGTGSRPTPYTGSPATLSPRPRRGRNTLPHRNFGPRPMHSPTGYGGWMWVAWGSRVVEQGCTSPPGGLHTTCRGYFYGEGDHTGQDYYAIDWPYANLNNIWGQDDQSATVKHAGWTQGSFFGYGIWVVLQNNNGITSYYAHLSSVSVTVGQTVTFTTQFAKSGCTGNCTGYHVHVTWCKNPSFDQYGQPYGGTSMPQTPLHTNNSTYPEYNSLSKGQLVMGW